MIARIINWANVEVALLVAPPNWQTEVTVSLEVPGDISKEAITLKESRRAFAQSARYSMKWRAYLSSAADATELRIFLTKVRGESVVVPLWPDACELAANISIGATVFTLLDTPARYGAPWIIANSDFSAFEIVSVSSLNFSTKVLHLAVGTHRAWTAGAMLFPLMVGRLDERPKPQLLTDETYEVDLSVKETSDFSMRLSPAPGAMPTVGNHVPPFTTTSLFTAQPNFSQPTDWTEQPDIVYEQIGFIRSEQQRVYDHRNPRGQEFEFFCNNRSDIGFIEMFWRAMRGPVLPFMVPTWRNDLRMRLNTPDASHPTYIYIEDSEFCDSAREAQPGDAFIALIDSSNAIDPRRLSSTYGVAGQMRLVSTTNMSSHTVATTIISHLLLARFQAPTLEWTYTTPYLGTTRLKFVELTAEYAAAPSPLPEPAYLFIFVENGIRTDRFTSYENTIQIPTGAYAGTYVPAPFSFDTLKTGLKLDQEKLEFKSFKFTGNPLNKLWPFALDGVLTLEVVEVVATNPTSATAVSRFYGDVWSVDSNYKASAIAFGNFFERKFPRFLLSVSDNYTQFSPSTHLAASAFKITGTIKTLNRTTQVVTITSAAAHAKAIEYYAGGFFETGTGANKERRSIYHSAPATGNDVTLHIDRPLLKAAVNQSIDLYPGYDGSIDQCDAVFNNRVNFGGHPYIPNVNPAVKAMKPKDVSGGKK